MKIEGLSGLTSELKLLSVSEKWCSVFKIAHPACLMREAAEELA